MTPASAAGIDESFMDRALEIARKGRGRVEPNPLVGSVVVSSGRIVGEGHHARYGSDHAEVVALRAAGDGALGATMYVTLEPCSHHGKTPPCTDAIRRAGVARLVYGCGDPDPRAGGGARVLHDAGLEVRGGVRGIDAARLNGPFIWRHRREGPWVALKLAISLDGRIAAAEGRRTDITGPEATEWVHRLRSGHDAVVIGVRTALVDDPLLTVRRAPSPRVPPTRVVLDPMLRLPVASRLVASVDEAPLLVLCGEAVPPGARRELERAGVAVLPVTGGAGGLDLDGALRALEDRGLRSLLVEGGGKLAGSLLAGGHVRRQYLLYAPVVLGPDGVPAFGAHFDPDSSGWRVVDRSPLGRDTLLELEDSVARDAFMEAA